MIYCETIEVKADFGSNKTELNQTNSNFPCQTILELTFFFAEKSSVLFDRTELYSKRIKKFECGCELVFNSVKFNKRLSFISFTV